MKSWLKVSPVEAHYLLFALDHYCATNSDGRVTVFPPYPDKMEEIQALRDELFKWHEHLEEEYDE